MGSTRPLYSHEFHVPPVTPLLAPFRPKIAGSGGTRTGECKCYGDFNSTDYKTDPNTPGSARARASVTLRLKI